MTQQQTKLRFRLRTIFVITTVIAIVLAAGSAWWRAEMAFFHGLLVGKTGPVPSRDDWPEPLRALLADAKGVELDESSIQVHCLCQGFDPEFVWQMDATLGLLVHLQQRWKLTQITRPDWPVLKGHSGISGVATPPWWSPKDDGNTAFFACPNEFAKEKSDRFQVAYDTRRKTIFVRYWFNF